MAKKEKFKVPRPDINDYTVISDAVDNFMAGRDLSIFKSAFKSNTTSYSLERIRKHLIDSMYKGGGTPMAMINYLTNAGVAVNSIVFKAIEELHKIRLKQIKIEYKLWEKRNNVIPKFCVGQLVKILEGEYEGYNAIVLNTHTDVAAHYELKIIMDGYGAKIAHLPYEYVAVKYAGRVTILDKYQNIGAENE